MSLYLGNGKVDKIYLGTNKVKQIYLGESLIYNSDIWVYWDNGPVERVAWGANTLTRKQPYSTNYCVIDSNRLRNFIYTSSSTEQVNGHFVTTEAIHIPSDATTIKMKVYCASNGYGFNDSNSVAIGLISKDSTEAKNFSYIARSSVSGNTYNSPEKAKTISGDCSAYAGSDDYKLMIYTNQAANSSVQRTIYIMKVWFE